MIRLLKIFLNEIATIWIYLLNNFPDSKLGYLIRGYFYRYKFNLKNNPRISKGINFNHINKIVINENLILGPNVTIDAGSSSGIFIGKFVSIASGSYIRSANHNFSNNSLNIQDQGWYCKDIEYKNRKFSIIIEDNVWIGANAIILSGSHIGTGSVISAGSVISNYIPPLSIVVGNPGRVIKKR